MSQPIYKLFQGRWTEAWYRLSLEEQQQLMAKVEEALAQVGGKTVLLCTSAWSNEQWQAFGIEEFPDLAALQQHSQLLAEFHWFRYIESTTTLGTAYGPPA